MNSADLARSDGFTDDEIGYLVDSYEWDEDDPAGIVEALDRLPIDQGARLAVRLAQFYSGPALDGHTPYGTHEVDVLIWATRALARAVEVQS